MDYAKFCKSGCGRVLTIDQMKTTKLCEKCEREEELTRATNSITSRD